MRQIHHGSGSSVGKTEVDTVETHRERRSYRQTRRSSATTALPGKSPGCLQVPREWITAKTPNYLYADEIIQAESWRLGRHFNHACPAGRSVYRPRHRSCSLQRRLDGFLVSGTAVVRGPVALCTVSGNVEPRRRALSSDLRRRRQ